MTHTCIIHRLYMDFSHTSNAFSMRSNHYIVLLTQPERTYTQYMERTDTYQFRRIATQRNTMAQYNCLWFFGYRSRYLYFFAA